MNLLRRGDPAQVVGDEPQAVIELLPVVPMVSIPMPAKVTSRLAVRPSILTWD